MLFAVVRRFERSSLIRNQKLDQFLELHFDTHLLDRFPPSAQRIDASKIHNEARPSLGIPPETPSAKG